MKILTKTKLIQAKAFYLINALNMSAHVEGDYLDSTLHMSGITSQSELRTAQANLTLT